MNATKWSDEAWRVAEPTYNAILRLPFITELAAGTLSRERFLRYIAQDSLYIAQYCRVLADIAARTTDSATRKAFLEFAADGVAVEEGLHAVYLPDEAARRDIAMSPACLFYTSVLKATAYEPVEVAAAAILPCFWIYQKVGKWIVEHRSGDANPYAEWIGCYSDPAFDLSNERAIALCDRMAQAATPDIRRRMTDAFLQSARMEWLFWHSAYTDLTYPVEI